MNTAAVPAATSIPQAAAAEVSLLRLYVLRAIYLMLVVGLGNLILPPIFSHDPMSRGVVQSLLGAVWVLAIIGLRHPLKMLPVLIFEFVWKTIWLLAYGLSQWQSGQVPPTFADDFSGILFGAILMPLVIPWGYVYRQYFKAAGERWK